MTNPIKGYMPTDKYLDTAAKVITRAADDMKSANDAAHARECHGGWRLGVPCKQCLPALHEQYVEGDGMTKDMIRYYRRNPRGNWSGD